MQNSHKKLLFIIDNLSTGGAQRQMVQLAVGLKRLEYDIDIFCYHEGDLLAQPLYDAGINVIWRMKKFRFSPDTIFEIRKLINKNRYDLAISFLPTPDFYAIISCHFMGRRIPVIISERSGDLPTGPEKIEQIVRPFYRFASHLVVNSHHQCENFIKQYPKLRERVSTIYNGYELNKFVLPFSTNANDVLRLLVVASVSPYKNGLCLIEALKILRQDHSLSPKVDWIGQRFMTGENGEYLQRMNEKIREYNLEEQWNWMGQRVDVIEQMHQHDVLIHPSYLEGLPNVVCEALASSLPVIVSNTLDHPLLIQDRESGFLFDHQSPDDLAAKIIEFKNLAPEQRKCMGESGRQFAVNNLSSERFIDAYKSLIDHVLQDS